MDLRGKIALITGSVTGIGAAIAQRFVADGARVCITGRRRQLLEQVDAALPEGSVTLLAGYVTNLADAQEMVTHTLDFGGKLDVLVNNAGVDNAGTIAEVESDLWKLAR